MSPVGEEASGHQGLHYGMGTARLPRVGTPSCRPEAITGANMSSSIYHQTQAQALHPLDPFYKIATTLVPNNKKTWIPGYSGTPG